MKLSNELITCIQDRTALEDALAEDMRQTMGVEAEKIDAVMMQRIGHNKEVLPAKHPKP